MQYDVDERRWLRDHGWLLRPEHGQDPPEREPIDADELFVHPEDVAAELVELEARA
ncbi:hypothetical protein ACFQJD_04550 [Haloplanus sp. GCM10025708]|uniref:hypothetical protein n=1 Tax=Haloferacaceae TaxID=1644056 RepID=UPI00361A6AC8